MEATTDERLMVWQFLRRYFVRIVIGSVLAVAVYGLLTVWMPYQREQRIAREIRLQGGDVAIRNFGPNWMPQSVKGRLPCFYRIWDVRFPVQVESTKLLSELGLLTSLKVLRLDHTQVTDTGLGQLKGLTSLELLDLGNTQVTDAGLEDLKGLTGLEGLDLSCTQVTDAGLEHLKGLPSLKWLRLGNTQVAAEGRSMLRKALPGCRIFPEDD